MVHHNPGEKPLDTVFTDPSHLVHYGFNGQAFKHINTVATFEAVAPGIFPASPEERAWLEQFTAERAQEIETAKAAGLSVWYHIDLFVLPKTIIEHFRSEIIDPETGRIDLRRPKTQELHRVLLREICGRFPQIDGFIVRVGETYLFDTPHHAGNGAVDLSDDNPIPRQEEDFILLLRFLRETICAELGKTLIHRTWDMLPDRFHASREFYLAVTEAVEPHPKLIFSVKHTRVDFHRWVAPNPCLGEGRHPQVIEVQCQREYEGKGAYPNYAAKGVIDGFAEPGTGPGIRPLMKHPLICGLYIWSRGGGWFGPYVTRDNELWSDLNAYVMAQFADNPERSEAALLDQYAREILGMEQAGDRAVFREIACRSLDAVVTGKCCAAYDSREKPDSICPTEQWMRDDVLHGMDKLQAVFDSLIEAKQVDAALAEKRRCIEHWEAMRERCNDFSGECPEHVREVITVSVEYGRRFFRVIAAAWEVLLEGYTQPGSPSLNSKIAVFDDAWSTYLEFCENTPLAATPYRAEGWNWPKKPLTPGLMASVDALRGEARV